MRKIIMIEVEFEKSAPITHALAFVAEAIENYQVSNKDSMHGKHKVYRASCDGLNMNNQVDPLKPREIDQNPLDALVKTT